MMQISSADISPGEQAKQQLRVMAPEGVSLVFKYFSGI